MDKKTSLDTDMALSGQHPSIPDIPDIGWRIPMAQECQLKCQPFMKPRLKQVPEYFVMGLRYAKFWVGKRRQGKRPFIDAINTTKHRPIYGCPLGGVGSGTIGRGYRGEFCRFQMVPGMYHYYQVDANQFLVCIRRDGQTVYQKVLSCAKRAKKKTLKSWDWSFPASNGTYHALYPRAWSVFTIPEFGVTLVCRQVSPVFPHDYLETSLPSAAFVWEIKNEGDDDLDISIVFTFKNGQGTKEDKEGGVWCQAFDCPCDGDKTARGVTINQEFSGMKCSYGISAKATETVTVTTLDQFNPRGDGADLWQLLHSTGQLHNEIQPEPCPPTGKGQEVASAVCATAKVAKHSRAQCEFALAWDMPLVHFAARENTYRRRYARLYGTVGNAAPQLCAHTLRNYPAWESKIDAWQTPILKSGHLPPWYKSALFNELYFVSDGGSIWIDVSEDCNTASTHPTVTEYGRFAYLEGQEYRMFNTYDVHHYSSFALLMLWPKLQINLQYDYGDTVMMEDPEMVKIMMNGRMMMRKFKNCVPHDIGDPEDEPWKRVNCYCFYPTSDWKDLNIKFILQTYRDFHATQDRDYLATMYPICKCLIDSAKEWDKDGDGVIDNSGYADQTFDAWVMKGASAYCGGMWLASLKMMTEMAQVLGLSDEQSTFQSMLDKGKAAFNQKLWNGAYYDYDSSSNGHHDSIMADQLAGHWFLKATGIPDETIYPTDNVHKALHTIYKNNVQGFMDGKMGAINGTRPNGNMDTSSPQSEEFWVGVTYALAATMIQEGMLEEGFKTAHGAHHVCWDLMGLHFQTPEAYTAVLNYRSLAYMRPLAIWAIQWAVEKFHPHLLTEGNDDAKPAADCTRNCADEDDKKAATKEQMNDEEEGGEEAIDASSTIVAAAEENKEGVVSASSDDAPDNNQGVDSVEPNTSVEGEEMKQ